MDLPSIVSSEWLNIYREHPNVLILDCTIAKPKSTIESIPNHYLQIHGARYFDIDHRFSNASIDLPHMMCNADQFQAEAQKLGINEDSLVVVYDQHGVYSSPRAWWMLKSMGHQNVAVLNGGLPEWINKGYGTEEKKTAHDSKGDFNPQFNSNCFVDSNFVLNTIGHKDTLVLDARSKGRFDGTEQEPRAGLNSGHVPNSISLPFPQVLDGNKMKPTTDLKRIFDPLKLIDKNLVFTCGSGLTACIILFAAHLAGYHQLAVYDGSWAEWGQDNELPVVKT